ncbi:pilus assembly protein [Microbacterium sp. CBS5P-1]|nr:pilus assembly protein [Microbacterium excoecariae]
MRRMRDERGSATVEFLLVSVLLTTFTLGVVQLGLAAYVRNVVQDAAVEAAFHAALADATPAEAEARARALVERAVGHDAIDSVAFERGTSSGVAVITVRIDATLPLVGFLGPARGTEVTARAPAEVFG